jgi:hypothetical protein
MSLELCFDAFGFLLWTMFTCFLALVLYSRCSTTMDWFLVCSVLLFMSLCTYWPHLDCLVNQLLSVDWSSELLVLEGYDKSSQVHMAVKSSSSVLYYYVHVRWVGSVLVFWVGLDLTLVWLYIETGLFSVWLETHRMCVEIPDTWTPQVSHSFFLLSLLSSYTVANIALPYVQPRRPMLPPHELAHRNAVPWALPPHV